MKKREIYLAGGCFWGTQKYLDSVRGVLKTEVGYANGNTENPTYEEVCSCGTGHAETVHVWYDAQQVSLGELLELYFGAVNPTSVNRQGGDIGSQYRTGIYYVDEKDLPAIERSLNQLQSRCDKPVAIEAKPLENFFPAEEYHQKYLDKNPNGYCHITPAKLERAKQAQPKGEPDSAERA